MIQNINEKSKSKAIEKKIVKKFKEFETTRNISTDFSRNEVKPLSINKIVKYSPQGFFKLVDELIDKSFEAFDLIDSTDQDFEYLEIDLNEDEFKSLKKVPNKPVYFLVEEQDVLDYGTAERVAKDESEVQEILKELSEDINVQYEIIKNGNYYVLIFMFRRLL